jgi:hypothetical protein
MDIARRRTTVPQDVIAHAWYSLGYRPDDSLVFVPVDRPIRRTGLVLRVNLPPPYRSREVVHHLARRVADRLLGAGIRATVLLVASDRAVQSPPLRVVRSFRVVLRQRGIEIRDVIGVSRRAFRSLSCRDRRCCPRTGHPLAFVAASPVAVMHARAGDTMAEEAAPPIQPLVAGIPDDAAPPTEPSVPDIPGDAVDRHPAPRPQPRPGRARHPDPKHPPPDPRRPHLPVSTGHPAPRGPAGASPHRNATELSPAERDHWWRVWTAALAVGDIGHPHRSGLAAALADPVLRNGVLATALGASPDARGPTEVSGWRQALETPPERIEGDQVDRATRVVALSVLCCPPEDAADGLAVLGVLHWYLNNRRRAHELALDSLRRRRGNSLASTLLGLLLAGVPPPWTRTPENEEPVLGFARRKRGDVAHDATGW